MSQAEEKLGGPCITVGDHVNTDVVIPGRYLVSIDPVELAKHAFEPLGEEFQQRLYKSRVLVAGRNFGCGSAREQAATCLIGAGVKAVVAASFARVFFRNAINTGLVAVQCPELVDDITDGDEIFIDLAAGKISAKGKTYGFSAYPENMQRILDAGGLMPFVAGKLKEEQRQAQ